MDLAHVDHYCAFAVLLAVKPQALVAGTVRVKHRALPVFSVILIFANVGPAIGPPVLAAAVQQVRLPLSVI